MITTRDLAAELKIEITIVEAYMYQLTDIDGVDAVVAAQVPLTNGSGRVIGMETTLTDQAAADIRTAVAVHEVFPLI